MSAVSEDALRAAFKSQYHSGLAMLRDAVERCPDDLWDDEGYTNRFWQIAYHALFFLHLYLQPRLEDFEAWSGHQAEVQHEDGIAGPADPDSELPLIPEPYSKPEVLAYCSFCQDRIGDWVDAIDFGSLESGFHWYPVSKLEHQLVNVRHVQHHAAQLVDRLRKERGVGVRWVGSRHPAP